jgi:pyruvate dehydrogenase complex dehydrogenase (E1) component
MPYQEKQPHGGSLTRPNKGETMNPHGRPRKYVLTLKAEGYKLHEINDCIQTMMAMTIDELKDAFENPNATVLEKTIAAAIKKSIQKGSLYSIETLLSRVYGKPKEQVDMDLSGEVHVTMNLNPPE